MTCWSKALMTLLLCACGLEARSALEAENSGSKAAFWVLLNQLNRTKTRRD